MRILHCIPFLSPKMGGSVQVVYHVSKQQAAMGHRVMVAASDHALAEAQFEIDGFELQSFSEQFVGSGFFICKGLTRWVIQNLDRFDIVNLHLFRTYHNPIVAKTANRFGVPYVVIAHGTLPIISPYKLIKKLYDVLWGNRVLKRAAHCIAVSPFEVGEYREYNLPVNKITVTYNGLNLDEFKDLPPVGSFKQKMCIPKDDRILLFVGRIHRRKGIEYLIQALPTILAAKPGVRLLVVGPDDGEVRRLEKMVEKLELRLSVAFLGPLYDVDKMAAMIDADLVVNPATKEIFGLVSMEALMCGTPVLVANDSGSGELLGRINAGYLVDYGNPEQLASVILEALDSPQQGQAMVQTGQKYIVENLSWYQIAEKYVHVYEGLLR
ncbi:glycosyltransferase [Chloroflexota bacterium]